MSCHPSATSTPNNLPADQSSTPNNPDVVNDNTDTAPLATARTENVARMDDKDSTTTTAQSAIDFLTCARGLKTTLRTGWIRQEASLRIESVADHSWRISLFCMLAANSSSAKLNVNKCIKMALVHDLAEAKVGDITPHCGIDPNDKYQQEWNAMLQMTDSLQGIATNNNDNDCSTIGDEIKNLWKEYEEGVTKEAKLVKDMDKLEMILQAYEYELDGQNQKSLQGFFDSTMGKFQTDVGRAWSQEIIKRRRKLSQSENK